MGEEAASVLPSWHFETLLSEEAQGSGVDCVVIDGNGQKKITIVSLTSFTPRRRPSPSPPKSLRFCLSLVAVSMFPSILVLLSSLQLPVTSMSWH